MKNKKTLKETLVLAGQSYQNIIRNYQVPWEVANDLGYFQCDACGSWEHEKALAKKHDDCGYDVCEHCLENNEVVIKYFSKKTA